MKALLHAHKGKRISVYVTEGGESKFLVVVYLTERVVSQTTRIGVSRAAELTIDLHTQSPTLIPKSENVRDIDYSRYTMYGCPRFSSCIRHGQSRFRACRFGSCRRIWGSHQCDWQQPDGHHSEACEQTVLCPGRKVRDLIGSTWRFSVFTAPVSNSAVSSHSRSMTYRPMGQGYSLSPVTSPKHPQHQRSTNSHRATSSKTPRRLRALAPDHGREKACRWNRWR